MREDSPTGPSSEAGKGPDRVQMYGVAEDGSTFIQVAGDQYILHLPPPPPPAAECTLPADTAAFSGREQELDTIVSAVTGAVESGRVVAVHSIDGMPGVGKTALAIRVGYHVREHFPDRQLFINLNAHTPGVEPTDPADALASLLTADGVDARYLPADLQGRAAMWRNRMAGKRVLLILDNATGSAQVEPLLPGAAGCLVLVTSRRYLGDLSTTVVSIILDVLPPEDAKQMFRLLAGREISDDGKLLELVALCGHLPLAISLLARVFNRHASWNLDQLLKETREKLLTVKAENRSVAATFGLSYQNLDVSRQHFFRYLGLHPGIEIDPYAAAALTGLPLDQSAEYLELLHNDSLLSEPTYQRYRMHDLIREYARNLVNAEEPGAERDLAVERLLDYYQYSAQAADRHLARYTRPAPVAEVPIPTWMSIPEFRSWHEAQDWMTVERSNLLACINYASSHDDHARVIGLTAVTAAHLRSDGPWTQAEILHSKAAVAARQLGDRLSEANALNDLGIRGLAGDYPGAADALDHAISIYRDLRDRLGEANALCQMGAVHILKSEFSEAADAIDYALDIYREIGDRPGQAQALDYLGVVRYVTGKFAEAATALNQALGISVELNDKQGQAQALNYLGVVRLLTGDYPEATHLLEQARSIYRALGLQVGHAQALNVLGVVQQRTGDYTGSEKSLDEAQHIYQELGDRLGQAHVLTDLGTVRRLTGQYEPAARVIEVAMGIYRDLGDRNGEGNALSQLGVVQILTGEYEGAAQALQEALSICRHVGNKDGEAEVLNHTGMLHLARGDVEQALRNHRSALEVAQAIESPIEEARALEGIGKCARAEGDTQRASDAFKKALRIFRDIGAADATRLEAEMNSGQPDRSRSSLSE